MEIFETIFIVHLGVQGWLLKPYQWELLQTQCGEGMNCYFLRSMMVPDFGLHAGGLLTVRGWTADFEMASFDAEIKPDWVFYNRLPRRSSHK